MSVNYQRKIINYFQLKLTFGHFFFVFNPFVYRGNFDQAVNLTLQTTQNGVADIIPNAFEIKPNTNVTRYTGVIFGNSPGRVEIIATAKPSDIIK